MKKLSQIKLFIFLILLTPTFDSIGIEINDKFITTINKRVDELNGTDSDILVSGRKKYKEYLTKNTKNIDVDDAKILEINVNYKTEWFYLKSWVDLYNLYLSNKKHSTEAYEDLFDKLSDSIEEDYKKFILNNDRLFKGDISVSEHDRHNELIINERKKATKVITEESRKNYEDESNRRAPRFTKLAKKRDLARNDVVAQVLNYASGMPEDASGIAFYYPDASDGRSCIYKVAVNKSGITGGIVDQLTKGLETATSFISAATGDKTLLESESILSSGIDLNKADLNNVAFYKLQGAYRNKFTGATVYLRYQSNVEGLPAIFECDSDSCNIDRLKRGWSLVSTKCKGATKAF